MLITFNGNRQIKENNNNKKELTQLGMHKATPLVEALVFLWDEVRPERHHKVIKMYQMIRFRRS